MRKRITSRRKDRRGAALVETAVVLPVFFLIVLGIIEFGRAFMVMQLVTTGAREATRSAISDGTNNEEVTSMVKSLVAGSVSIPEDEVAVTISIDEADGNPDTEDEIANANKRDAITIDVAVQFADVSFVTPNFLSGATIRGSSVMRHE